MNYLYSILLLVGIILLLIAYLLYNKTKKLLETGVRTQAEVIELIRNYDSDGDTYTPVFSYIHHTGETKTYTSKISSSPPAYDVGEIVNIVYNPDDDQELKTITFWGLYRWSIILLIAAAALIIIGGGYTFYTKMSGV